MTRPRFASVKGSKAVRALNGGGHSKLAALTSRVTSWEGLLQHRVLGPILKVPDSAGLGQTAERASLRCSQVMLQPLALWERSEPAHPL